MEILLGSLFVVNASVRLLDQGTFISEGIISERESDK